MTQVPGFDTAFSSSLDPIDADMADDRVVVHNFGLLSSHTSEVGLIYSRPVIMSLFPHASVRQAPNEILECLDSGVGNSHQEVVVCYFLSV